MKSKYIYDPRTLICKFSLSFLPFPSGRVYETGSTVGGTGVVVAGHVSGRHGNVQGLHYVRTPF